ncbi:MAG: efflux RND transporter periplasmic adaptor subunit [bacterium]
MIASPNPRKKFLIIVIIIFLLIISITWWFLGRIEVKTYKIEKQDAIKGITVTGTVESRHDIQLAASVTGKIREIKFHEGDFVQKGQILAFLDNKEASGNLISAKGQLETSQAQLKNLETEPRYQQIAIARAKIEETKQNIGVLQQNLKRTQLQLQDAISEESRLSKLYQQGAVSYRDYEKSVFAKTELEASVNGTKNQIQASNAQLNQTKQNLDLIIEGVKTEEIQAAQGQVQVAQGGIESTSGRLDNYILKAPISGYITQKILDKGEVASPTSPILRLVNPKSLYISAQVEENELKDIKTGQSAFIIFDAYPDRTFISKVIEILRDVNPITGTFEAKFNIPADKNLPVIVGMTSDITVVVQELKDTIIIPSEFISTKDKKQFVYKKTGNRAEKTFVEIITFDNNRTRVLKGLKQGDIILKGLDNKKIKPNDRIKISTE